MSSHAKLESQTFLFADLAGFTALTEAHGDEEAVAICRRFKADVTALADELGAEVVKTIGDAVMIRMEDAPAAVELGRRIVAALAGHRLPPVRVGIHSGPVIAEDGDYFGATVNLASRVTSAAGPGEVLITAATREAAGGGGGLEPRGRRSFKNVGEPVEIFAAASRPAGRELDIDPVCRMAVERERAARVIDCRRRRFYFCSDRCANAFDANRPRYAGRSIPTRAADAARRLVRSRWSAR